MAFANREELVAAITSSMGALGTSTSESVITSAAGHAESELGWATYPVSDIAKETWLVERGRRHALMILCVEAASKFQFKKIYLQHRFNNYFRLLEFLDKKFEEAVENNPELFPDIGTYGSSYFIDGMSYISGGFVYDDAGVDRTYEDA
jgi:hypothetical protein